MIYKHDCKFCKPLGEFNGHDLYYCDQKQPEPTLIARFGNEGPDYTSGMIFGKQRIIPELAEAHARAIQRGYMKRATDAYSGH